MLQLLSLLRRQVIEWVELGGFSDLPTLGGLRVKDGIQVLPIVIVDMVYSDLVLTL